MTIGAAGSAPSGASPNISRLNPPFHRHPGRKDEDDVRKAATGTTNYLSRSAKKGPGYEALLFGRPVAAEGLRRGPIPKVACRVHLSRPGQGRAAVAGLSRHQPEPQGADAGRWRADRLGSRRGHVPSGRAGRLGFIAPRYRPPGRGGPLAELERPALLSARGRRLF